MNRNLFDLYVDTQLAATLGAGDVIILDNLSSHKSPKAAAILEIASRISVLSDLHQITALTALYARAVQAQELGFGG